jgi:hypothetical protein
VKRIAKTFLSEVDGWTPLIDNLITKYDLVTAAVFGRIWRYSQLWSGVCKASLPTIADDLKLARSTVKLRVAVLCKDGYLSDMTPNLQGRPHIYKVTDKVTIMAKFTANVDTAQPDQPLRETEGLGSPLRETEGLKNCSEKPLRETEGPLRETEGYPSEKSTGPLRETAISNNTFKDTLVKDRVSPAKAWKMFVAMQQSELPRHLFEGYLAHAEYLHFADDTFVVQAPPWIAKWLDSRLKSVAKRSLTGIMNQTVDVVFVERE